MSHNEGRFEKSASLEGGFGVQEDDFNNTVKAVQSAFENAKREVPGAEDDLRHYYNHLQDMFKGLDGHQRPFKGIDEAYLDIYIPAADYLKLKPEVPVDIHYFQSGGAAIWDALEAFNQNNNPETEHRLRDSYDHLEDLLSALKGRRSFGGIDEAYEGYIQAAQRLGITPFVHFDLYTENPLGNVPKVILAAPEAKKKES